MSENTYEEYKRDVSRKQEKSDKLFWGKIYPIVGIALLIFLLCIIPYHADDVSKIRGDEVKAGSTVVKVYYIENLQLLHAKVDVDKDELYCIARFSDCDQKEWIVCFTPDDDERLVEQIKRLSTVEDRYSGVVEKSSYTIDLEKRADLTVSGYFQMQDQRDLSAGLSSFFSVYGEKYADAEGKNMLNMNARYLCDKNENYLVEVLLTPGMPLGFLVLGLFFTIRGTYLFLKNRPKKGE